MQNDGKLRLLRLLELIWQETDEHHEITVEEIRAKLMERWGIEAYRTTVQNDVEVLKAAGLDIQTVRSTQNRYSLLSRDFELAELKLLLDAVESSKFITQKKSEELAEKLLKLTSRHCAENLKRNFAVGDRLKQGNEFIYYYVDKINDAINRGKKISFLYYRFAADKTKRLKNGGEPYILSPYALSWNGDFYYVVGRSEKHGKIAQFRVDRIYRPPEILDEDAVPSPEGFSIADYSEKAFSLFDGERETVELICGEAAMNSVMDHFGEGADITPRGDGRAILRAEVSLSPTFYGWVFQFGGDIKILAPEKAKNEYRKMLEMCIDGETAALERKEVQAVER